MSNVCQIFLSLTLDTLDKMVYTLDIFSANSERMNMEAIMARAFTEETRAEQQGNHTVTSAITHKSACVRCGGLMVTDFSMDLLFCIGETEFAAQRCVQCGEIVDPVILRNRRVMNEPMTTALPRRMLPANRVTKCR